MATPGTPIAEKERQAYSMLARGLSLSAISRSLCISEVTVKRYVDRRKKELAEVVNKISQEDYATMVLSRFDQLLQEAWANYESSEKEVDRGRYLKLIADIYGKEQKALMELGLLDKQPEKTEHTVNARVLVDNTDKSQLDALTAMLLSQRLGKTPEELLEMGGRGAKSRVHDVFPPLPAHDGVDESISVTPVLDSVDLD